MLRLAAALCLFMVYLPLQAKPSAQGAGHGEKHTHLPASIVPTEDAVGRRDTGEVADADAKKNEDSRETKSAVKDWNWFEAASLAVNFGLLCVGVWAGITATRALKTLIKQTESAGDAATAALRSADAVIAAERALLLFRVWKQPKGSLRIVRCKNYGGCRHATSK